MLVADGIFSRVYSVETPSDFTRLKARIVAAYFVNSPNRRIVPNKFRDEKFPGSDDFFKQLIEAHGLGLPEQYMVAIDALYDKSAVTAEPVIYLCEQGRGMQTDQKIPEHCR